MTPEHFRTIRTSLGLSLAQLAAIIRIEDIRTIRRYERGERSVSGPITVLMEMLEEAKSLHPFPVATATH